MARCTFCFFCGRAGADVSDRHMGQEEKDGYRRYSLWREKNDERQRLNEPTVQAGAVLTAATLLDITSSDTSEELYGWLARKGGSSPHPENQSSLLTNFSDARDAPACATNVTSLRIGRIVLAVFFQANRQLAST